MKNKVALITGASSGIGLEIAKCLAKRGFDLVLTARNSDKLSKTVKNLSAKFPVSIDSVVSDLHDSKAPNEIHQFWKMKMY